MKYKIGDVVDIIDGDRGSNYPKQDEFFNSGYCLFLDTGNVRRDGFSFEETHFITEDKCNALRKGKMQRGDIAYTTRGTVGNAAYFNDSVPFEHIRINSGMVILRTKSDKVIGSFLYQLLKHDSCRTYIKGYCTGSAQPQLPIKNFSQIEIDIPSLATQERISSVMTAYDSLIENNQKQIKLLEEAAQRLYKEWFVDLHFPGYENTPVVDGVPEGWQRVSVTDLLEIKYGKDHKALEDGTIPVYGSGGVMRKVKPVLYSGESVLIPRKGSLNNILLVSGDFWTIDTMFYSVPRMKNVAKYAFHFLSGLDMYSFNIGAAVPSMTVKILESISLFLPTEKLLEKFEAKLSPCYDRMSALKGQNELLAEARDILLPKLMNGEIEV